MSIYRPRSREALGDCPYSLVSPYISSGGKDHVPERGERSNRVRGRNRPRVQSSREEKDGMRN